MPVCPNCLTPETRPFYEVRQVPVHSVLLMRTPMEARTYRRGDLELAFCDHCGFVGNCKFDPAVHEYSMRCEESQGYSDTFNAFARTLAAAVVQRYDVRAKTVLEIGCGKGEFLRLVCALGGNKGIGIDPAFVPERMDDSGVDLRFIQDLYSEKYAHLTADVVICRHTLEHIAPTHEFMSLVRRTIGDRTDTLVFFELPDALRVLREGAFWDIYYEHCSYFTPGSLSRLFRATGFEVIDLELDYDDQYILIAARPVEAPCGPCMAIENDLAATRETVARFPEVCGEVRRRWKTMLAESFAKGQRSVVWGGGSKGVAFLTTLALDREICCVVDINPYKQGKYMPGTGHEVVAPSRLTEYRPDHVILMNPIYRAEVQAELDRLGIPAELHTV
jgi:SAM-dependent methyltransferase